MTGRQIMNTKETTMKTSKLTRMSAALALGAAAFLNAIPNASALDNWQIVNNFQGVPGMSAGSTALQTDASRTLLFDAGSAYMDTSGIRPAILRMSADQGATWTILDEFSDPNWQWACYRAMVCGSNSLYGAGFLQNNNQGVQETWFVRESTDGVNWTTTDVLPGPASVPVANCAAIGVAKSGDVYAAGTCGTNWTVRKKAVGANLYQTVDTCPTTRTDQSAQGIGFHSTAGVFVVGYTPGTSGLFQWLVRRSANQGSSWSTVDRFVSDRYWTQSKAGCVAVDASGRIYVAGSADYLKGRTTTAYWLVRRSTDGGNTWSTVDQISYGTKHWPWAMTTDASGNILVCGYVQTANGQHWVVRKGIPAANGSITWVLSDDYQLAAGQDSSGRGIVCDAGGNLFVTGMAKDAEGIEQWMTRKLTP